MTRPMQTDPPHAATFDTSLWLYVDYWLPLDCHTRQQV